jgi:hypothetical protein
MVKCREVDVIRTTMVLRGGLSNTSISDLVHFLTSDEGLQTRPKAKPKSGWSDGRRGFGTVSGAIKTVLAGSGSEMRLKTIHVEVERVLGGPVSFQSVADYLIKNSKRPKPLFVRTRYGHYSLLG